MIELWIPITVTAALFQTWRTALQQRLRGQLSVNAAGFVRYLYAIPTGLILVFALHGVAGTAWPTPNARFFADSAIAGLLQIFGTSLLIMAFGFRSFAVGTAYSKTEAVQGAIMAWIILGEALLLLARQMLRAPGLTGDVEYQWILISTIGSLNLWMGALNLIPCLPWDGGLIVTALLWYRMTYTKALRITAHLSLVLGPALFLYGFVMRNSFFELFGGVAAFTSYMTLRNTGGIRFGEAFEDRRLRKEEIAFKKRQADKREIYLGDVIERQREREEQERLRKLLE